MLGFVQSLFNKLEELGANLMMESPSFEGLLFRTAGLPDSLSYFDFLAGDVDCFMKLLYFAATCRRHSRDFLKSASSSSLSCKKDVPVLSRDLEACVLFPNLG